MSITSLLIKINLSSYGNAYLLNETVSPSEEEIAAVVNAQTPKNASEVHLFVHLVQHSPNFSQVVEPLRKRKDQAFVWVACVASVSSGREANSFSGRVRIGRGQKKILVGEGEERRRKQQKAFVVQNNKRHSKGSKVS